VTRCDPVEVVKALSTLLDDSGLRGAMGKRGRELVTRCFTWEVAAGQMVNLYEEILRGASQQE
jgi:glycosyltransferase involved in cell wall biosynthesis